MGKKEEKLGKYQRKNSKILKNTIAILNKVLYNGFTNRYIGCLNKHGGNC